MTGRGPGLRDLAPLPCRFGMSQGGNTGLLRPPDATEHLSTSRDFATFERDHVETVAREIQLLGATVPAVLFLEANRGAGSLDGLGMLFFDPILRGIFGGDDPGASHLLADDDDIERLIERLEELDAEADLYA